MFRAIKQHSRPEGFSRFAPFKMFLTHRSNTRGHDAWNGTARWEKLSGLGTDTDVTTFPILWGRRSGTFRYYKHTLPFTCSPRVQLHREVTVHRVIRWAASALWLVQPKSRTKVMFDNGQWCTGYVKERHTFNQSEMTKWFRLKDNAPWCASDQPPETERNLSIYVLTSIWSSHYIYLFSYCCNIRFITIF